MARRFTIPQHAQGSRVGQPGVLLLILLALVSCSPREETGIALPPTPVIGLRPTWAVVSVPYLRLRTEPSAEASISAHLRRGDVARVEAIGTTLEQVEGGQARWYLLSTDSEQGWALDTALQSFVSERRAINLSRRLRGE